MRAISRRLHRLEQVLVPSIRNETGWGALAGLRGQLLRLVEPQGAPAIAQLKIELDALGPTGLWRELVRCHLQQHGFVQSDHESFAELVARALGITVREFRFCLQQGRLGVALAERFRQAE
jgi:hypothetical protein